MSRRFVAAALGALSAWSAADGYGWASRCDAVKAAQPACVSGVEASCVELRGQVER